MNKLDEILQKLALELEVNELDMVMVTGETCREMLIKEAKQAIIELIEGEIIGDDETVMTLVSSYRQVVNARNNFREEQKQKLQKLKE